MPLVLLLLLLLLLLCRRRCVAHLGINCHHQLGELWQAGQAPRVYAAAEHAAHHVNMQLTQIYQALRLRCVAHQGRDIDTKHLQHAAAAVAVQLDHD
jgi:hypothetical protein